MKRLQAFRFALRPTEDQERTMRQFAGACRYVYNRALDLEVKRYESGEKRLGYIGLANLLPVWKRDTETVWLSGTHSQILQQALKDLDRAYVNFFGKRAGFPKFRKKGEKDAFRYPQGVKLNEPDDRIFLPRIGWIRYRKSRRVEGAIRNVTVRRSGEKWFVSLQTEREVGTLVHPNPGVAGLDLGVVRFATLSDGTAFAPGRFLKTRERELRRIQRALSRKKKGSKNWQKNRIRLSRLHRRIADARNDFLHKVSTTICKSHAVVVIEDLKVKGMSASASGTKERSGKNVRQKAGLNRSILDQGWGAFVRMLDYKSAWKGGMVLRVDPRNTSRTCSSCGHVSPDSRKTQSDFLCVSCGFGENADTNAARNILRAGHARIACGTNTSPEPGASAQEPAEAAWTAVGIPFLSASL